MRTVHELVFCNFWRSCIFKNGVAVGLNAALFGTGELIALITFLRPRSWRPPSVDETLTTAWEIFGGVVLPAILVGVSLSIVACKGGSGSLGFRRVILYLSALFLGYMVAAVGIWWQLEKFALVSTTPLYARFIRGFAEAPAVYPLVVLPALGAARASEKWIRSPETSIWRLRVMWAMSTGSVLLFVSSLVFVAAG